MANATPGVALEASAAVATKTTEAVPSYKGPYISLMTPSELLVVARIKQDHEGARGPCGSEEPEHPETAPAQRHLGLRRAEGVQIP